MVSISTEKTYSNYVKSFFKWCRSRNIEPSRGLSQYKEFLMDNKCKSNYIKNVTNVIAKLTNISVERINVPKASKSSFSREELERLREVSLNNYREEEISLILLLLMETRMKIKNVLRLTLGEVNEIVCNGQTTSGERIQPNALYLFEYLLSTSIYADPTTQFFKKTYNGYYHSFKERQKYMFPNKRSRSFKALQTQSV